MGRLGRCSCGDLGQVAVGWDLIFHVPGPKKVSRVPAVGQIPSGSRDSPSQSRGSGCRQLRRRALGSGARVKGRQLR